jgi:ribosomal protein L29
MKEKQKKELHQKTVEALQEQAEKLRFEIAQLVLRIKAGKEKNTSILKTKKADLARVLTIISKKKLEK